LNLVKGWWKIPCGSGVSVDLGLDPTWPSLTYYWPAVNKWLIGLWPGYFLTQPGEIFLNRREKIEKFVIFRGNFPNSNPKPKMPHSTRPRSKNFWPGLITSFLTQGANAKVKPAAFSIVLPRWLKFGQMIGYLWVN